MSSQPRMPRLLAMASRYGLVGASCAALNIVIVWCGTEVLRLAYPLAVLLTCPITIPISYVLHRRISFEMTGRPTWVEFFRFAGTQLSQFAIGSVLLALVVETLHLRAWIAMAIVTALMAAYGFLASSTWVFHAFAPRRGAAPAIEPSPARPGPASDRPLRLLQVSAFFGAHGGGIEAVAGQLAHRLADAGVEVTWMAGGPAGERPLTPLKSSLVIDQATSVDFLEARLGLPAPLWSPGSLLRLWRHVGASDVVQLHDCLYMPTLFALVFARLRRRRVVITQHVGEIAYSSRAARGTLRMLNHVVGRFALGAAFQVVFVGQPVMRFFDRIVRYRRPPALIPNGVDHDVYHPSALLQPVGGALRVLFVGRFVEKKGLGLLRDCVDLPGIRWTFVGRGPMSPGQWHVSAAIELPGPLAPEDVADAMRAADLLVLPSHGEGFPLVVQEALACGTPVLVSQEVADAFPEIDRRCVWAVDVSGDAGARRLRAALEALVQESEGVREARMPAAALARQWSWERCVETYLEMYRAA